MPVFSGSTSTSALSTAYNIPATIKSFSITNKSGGAVTVNVSVLYGSTNIWVTELNKSLAAGEILEDSKEIKLLAGRQIYVLVSGQCDYYFSIE
jgi:hypothetical protein